MRVRRIVYLSLTLFPTSHLVPGIWTILFLFMTETNSYATHNRLGVIKLLRTINRQCPQFKLYPTWEEVRIYANVYAAQPSERRSTSRPAPRPHAPRAATPAAHLSASSAHHYESSTSPHHPSTTISEPTSHRSSIAPDVALHRTHGRTTRSEQVVDGSAVGDAHGPHTSAAALRRETDERHHTYPGLSLSHSLGTRERYMDNSPREQ